MGNMSMSSQSAYSKPHSLSDWFKNGLQTPSQINETQVWDSMELERTLLPLCDRQNLKDNPQDFYTLVFNHTLTSMLLWRDFAGIIKVLTQLTTDTEIIWVGLTQSNEPFKSRVILPAGNRRQRDLEPRKLWFHWLKDEGVHVRSNVSSL